MRTAIISLTTKGTQLAEKIAEKVGGQIFAKGRNFTKLADLVAEIFGKFDGMIFICAAGIVVRIIAPHIVSKLSDPAVLVIDERGQNVISLLSGHVGRANELTVEVAKALDANPVITTATDVAGQFSVDAVASKLGLVPEPKEAIKVINTAILRGEDVYVQAGDVRLNLIPQNLVAGVGCRRGTSSLKIFEAIQRACAMIHQPIERVKLLASADAKKDETGLLSLAEVMGLEIKFFSAAELQKKIDEYKLGESKFVTRSIGVGNVCEAAALCCVENARFALPKTSFKGVTVALLWER
ncbi:MAG: cobalt-precorrin 5A hydrolase [Selenomonadaceae bacterium]|nr:cobalt-precorrin 5A hydrolase [Selenomonadaceae bacterium]MBQ7492825.1 cobalt-precorrin 5A hydrolase [Selenomonadaceae bacterium]